MATPVYSYIRFSSKKQEKGDSLRRQTKGGEEWIALNADKGYVAANLTLHDIGVSAFRGKNKHTGALKRFLQEVEAGRVEPGSILLVEHLDRLSRQGVGEAYALFTQILNAGVQIAVLKPYEQIYTRESVNDLVGLLLPLIYFYLAFVESKTKSDRLRKVWEHKRERAQDGIAFDRRRPSWVDWDESSKTFVLNHGAEAVRFIFRLTSEGFGQRRILKELVKRFPPIGTSQRWNSSFVQKVLNDRAVLGERVPKTADEDGRRVQAGKPLQNYYPAVIDEELWFRAQASKEANKRHKGPSSKFINLFAGLLFNAHDGFPMHVQTARKDGHKRRRIVSYGHVSEIEGADTVSVCYRDFEANVLRYLHELRPEAIQAVSERRDELPLKEQELSGMELRLLQLREALSDPGVGNLPTVLAAVADLEERRARAIEEISILRHESGPEEPLEGMKNIVATLAEVDESQRDAMRTRLRALLGQLIENIIVKPEKHFGRVYVLVQVNFKNGRYKQIGFGPGFYLGFNEQTCLSEVGVNLTDRVAANSKSVFAKIAEIHAQPPEAPVVDVVPEKIGDAGEVWLRLQRSRMAKDSFRVVPAKVRRFVKFVGHCRSTSEAGRHWNDWVGWLKVEIAAGRMAPATARVTLSRSREFLRWLIEKGVVDDLAELNVSAEVALGLKDRKKEGAA